MQTVIKVDGLTKCYGKKTAVDQLSFEVGKGEIFGLLGHNGAGKTTTIECILGTRKMDSGSVEILGMVPTRDRKKLFERIGVQFQQANFQDKIRVSEACEVSSALYRKPLNYKKLLKTFGLEGMEKKTVSELSGGERQKLAVLQALIPDPEVVFLDELTTGLDSKARREVWRLLADMKGRGMTIVLTSHYMDEVEALCDRVCILKEGRAVAMDTVKELTFRSPYEKFEEAYLWYSGEEETEYESISCINEN